MKKKIINAIIGVEGGYVNDPADSGGETNYGITVAVARENGYSGRMDCMPREVAFEIYANRYWDSVHADDLLLISDLVTAEVVDTAINLGPRRASRILQRSLNAMNNRGTLYPDITVDGLVGRATINALRQYTKVRDPAVLCTMLNCLQGYFYVMLSERREKDERFIYGWFKNRITLKGK